MKIRMLLWFCYTFSYSLSIIASDQNTAESQKIMIATSPSNRLAINLSKDIPGTLTVTTDFIAPIFCLNDIDTGTGTITVNGNVNLGSCIIFLILRRTIIKGNVVFQSPERGRVIIEDDCTKIEGSIINGTVYRPATSKQ